MSHRRAERSLNELEKNNDGKQALYGITQDEVFQDLPRESYDFISDDFLFYFFLCRNNNEADHLFLNDFRLASYF